MKGSEGAEREDIIDIVIARFSGRSGLVVFPSGKRVPLFTGLVLRNQTNWMSFEVGREHCWQKLRYFNF